MKFAFYSAEGAGLSWAKRLVDEGHDVLLYVDTLSDTDSVQQRFVGDGIVRKTRNIVEWMLFGKGGIHFFDSSHYGAVAEKIRARGELVIGAGDFCDRLEEDREFGFDLAREAGIKIPEYERFTSIPDAVRKLKKMDGERYFKTDRYIDASSTFSGSTDHLTDRLHNYIEHEHGTRISGILQEKLDGFALSTSRWWNGQSFVGPYQGDIEHKKFLENDLGPATGCSFNYIWFYRDDAPPISTALNWERLGALWRRHKAPPGTYDINALLNEKDGDAYFLEWTPRCGYDSEPTAQLGITNLGGFLEALVHGRDVNAFFDRSKVYGSVRLTVPPYPAERVGLDHPASAKGEIVRGIDGLWSKHFITYGLAFDPAKGGYYVADPEGLVGLAAARGQGPNLFREVYNFIENELNITDLQYRPDAQERVEEDIKTISRLGYSTR